MYNREKFHESNILMEMMALVLEDKIKHLIEEKKDPKCAGSEIGKGLQHTIKIDRRYDYGDAPFVLSELKHQNIDLYAEYSGALLYNHLSPDDHEPIVSEDGEGQRKPPKPNDEKEKYKPEWINYMMSWPQNPDFHKMKLLPSFGFDSGIELVMLKSTAERLGMLKDGRVTYDMVARNANKLAVLGDRDLFNRWDALGGLRKQFKEKNPNFEHLKQIPVFHEDLYSELNKYDCQGKIQDDNCKSPIEGAVAIGFKTDPVPEGNDQREYVKVVGDKVYELPEHWASPMVHMFLNVAFPDLQINTTLESLKTSITNPEMISMIKEAKKYEKLPQSELKKKIEEIARRHLIGKKLIKP